MSPEIFEDFDSGCDLRQGDILRPTEELKLLFEEVHPHFNDEKYLAFLVISQTCDLVVRDDGKCSAAHINVAVVRSLADVLPKLLASVCKPVVDGVYFEKSKSKATDLLHRILNQNESALGLFYLFPDGSVELGEDAVAFLRISVAFRREHYGLMKDARSGRLHSDFANKLGWLVGNLYSRIGTPDWEKKALTQKVKDLLKPSGGPSDAVWIQDRKLRHILKENEEELSREELIKKAKLKLPSPKDEGLDEIIKIASEIFQDLDDKAVEKLRIKMSNSSVLTACFRQ